MKPRIRGTRFSRSSRMDLMRLREAATCVDEALHVYRTSTTAWETASSYYRPSDSTRPHSYDLSDPGIRHVSRQLLPSTFTSHFLNVQFKSFMGLFPQINRVWLTVDSNLFLWAYTPVGQTSPTSDMFVYEGFSQIIMSVALITPRPGIFVDSVRYLIAVATTVEISLLGVTFSSSGQLDLVPTQISISTDNVYMLKILSSDDGRLFMAGADGNLHQFVYASNHPSSFFDIFGSRPYKRARRIAHSSSVVSQFLPTLVKSLFSGRNELVDLAIEGNSLFTLSQAGLLTVYDISDNMVKSIAASLISTDVKHLFNFTVSSSDREYVSIHTVASTASSSVQLIVVTSWGERIYYSTRSSGVTSPLHPPTRPSTLRCIAYRPSPDSDCSRSSARLCVHMAWCHRGAAIFADLKDNEFDRLICVYPDINILSTQPGRSESAVHSRSGEVVITSFLRPSREFLDLASPAAQSSHEPSAASNSPIRTFAIAGAETKEGSVSNVYAPMDPHFFWVLTSSAIHLFERVSAMDKLRNILSRSPEHSDGVKKFFERYGVADSCAMCLEIAIIDSTITRTAANMFYSAGGTVGSYRGQISSASGVKRRTGADSLENTFSFHNRFDVGRAAIESTPLARFSGAHDGVTLYLAKLLHPIWSNYVTSDRNPDGYHTLSDSKENLGSVRDRLLSLISFMERYSPDDLLPKARNDDERVEDGRSFRGNRRFNEKRYGSTSEEDGFATDRVVHGLYELKRTDEARRVESDAIRELIKLAARTAEALALLMIAHDHQMHRLTLSMGKEGRQRLVECRINDLVSTEQGEIVALSLISAMFSIYNDEAAATANVGSMLQQRCGIFFNNVVEELHQGLSLLRRAVSIYSESMPEIYFDGGGGSSYGSTEGWSEYIKKADEAVMVLKNVAGNIFDLKTVFNDFKKVKAIPGLVDVGLTIGKEAEDSNRKLRAKEAYDEVLSAIKELITESNEVGGSNQGLREASLRIALNSTSETFLRRLYELLRTSRRGQEVLLKEWNDSVENYLMEHEASETLWKYYTQHGRHFEAATILLKLAETSEVELVDRLNYLSCALLNAKTGASKGDERASGLMVELSDILDVTKVQVRIRDELQSKDSKDSEVKAAVKELNSEIMDLSLLFNNYARRFQLHECCLECLRCGSYRDDKYVHQVWLDIVRRESRRTESRQLLRQSLEAIGRQFYPNEIVMPIDFVIDVLEQYNIHNGEPQLLWALNILRGIGIPWADLVDGYRKLLEQGGGGLSSAQLVSGSLTAEKPTGGASIYVMDKRDSSRGRCWTEEKAQLHLLQVTELVMNHWIDDLVGEGSAADTRRIICEGDKAMRMLQLAKSRLRAMSRAVSNTVLNSFEQLEKRMLPIVQ